MTPRLRSFKPLNAAGFFLRVAQMRPLQFQRLALWDVVLTAAASVLAALINPLWSGAGVFAGLILSNIIAFILMTGWTRLFVTGEIPGGEPPFRFGRNERQAALAAVIMGVGFALAALIGALFITLFAVLAGEPQGGAWTVLAGLIVLSVLIYFFTRFTSAVALSLIEARLAILTAWRQSADIWGRVLLGHFIVVGAAAVGMLVLAILLGLFGISTGSEAGSMPTGLQPTAPTAESLITVILSAVLLFPARLTGYSLAAVLALRGDDMSTPWLRQMDELEQRSAERYDDFG